jgi:hypothetical protein
MSLQVRVALDCPGFRHAQKSVLWQLSGMETGKKAGTTHSAPAKLERESSQDSSISKPASKAINTLWKSND